MSKEVVVPGELLSTESKQLGSHTFAVGEKIFSDCFGVRNESDDRIAVVPLRGKYLPVENDVIIGVVKNEKFAGYDVEINSFYPSFVSKQDLREPLKVGSVVSAKVVKVNELNEADVGMVRPLHQGEIVSVTPVKVPRIIGKNASMLNAIKNGTGSTVMVGRNGFIWVNGGNTQVAVEAIQRIEEYSHAENLTHDIQCFLAAKTGQGIPGTQGPSNEESFGTDSGFGGGMGRNFRGGRGSFQGRGGGGRDFRPRPPMRGGFGGPRRDNFRSGGGAGGGDFGRPRFNNRGPMRNDRMGGDRMGGNFRPNPRFGSQYDGPPRDSGGFDRRKRFPRNDRVSGNEDPTFD